MFTTNIVKVERFLSTNSERVIEKVEHACIGVSPFNSYFSENTLFILASWAKFNFKSFSIFIPDEPAVYTMMALGYSERESIKKVKKQNRYLRNKVARALMLTGISMNEIDNYILNWKELTSRSIFNEIHNEINEAFEWDSDFRKACIEASRWVLENKMDPTQITEAQLEIAVKYFLAECPLFVNTAAIVGAESSVFCYHQSPPFLVDLYESKLSVKPAMNQSYALISTLMDD